MISIVVPVYRNEGTLGELGRRVGLAMEGVGEFELILVVDCSPDASGEVARGMALRDGRVKVVELAGNVGQNRAVLVGMGVSRGDVVVVMDGDLQDLPEDVPGLVGYLRDHVDVKGVCARRVNRYSGVGRFLTGRAFKAGIWAVSLGRVPWNGSLFMAVRGEVAREMAMWRERRVHVLSLASVLVGRGEMRAIPLRRAEAEGSGYTGGMRMKVAWAGMRTVMGWPAVAEKKVVLKGDALEPVGEARGLEERRAVWGAMGVAAVMFVLRMLLSVAGGWNLADEAWVLQVVVRCARGEVLYRDVYYGAMPLPIYLARGVCFVLGYSAVVMKGVFAAMDVGIFLGVHRVLMELGRRVKAWKLGVVMILLPVPLLGSLYADMATMCFVWGAVGVVWWARRQTLGRAVMIGVWVGLCLAAKQNVGVCLMVGVVVTMGMVMGRGRRWGQVACAVGVAILLAGVTVLPVVWSGAWGEFVRLGFLNKGSYVRVGSVSFFEGFGVMGYYWSQMPGFGAVSLLLAQMVFPVMLVVGALTVVGLFGGGRGKLLRVMPLVVMLVLTVFPRADAAHVVQAFPAVVVCGVLCAAGWTEGMRRWVGRVVVGVAVFCVGVLTAGAVWRVGSGEVAFSPFGHTRGVLMEKGEIARLEGLRHVLRAERGPVLILSVEASGLYLISGVGNPVRVDYPLANAWVPGEVETVLAMVSDGRISTVVVDKEDWMMPGELVGGVRGMCREIKEVGRFEVWVNSN